MMIRITCPTFGGGYVFATADDPINNNDLYTNFPSPFIIEINDAKNNFELIHQKKHKVLCD